MSMAMVAVDDALAVAEITDVMDCVFIYLPDYKIRGSLNIQKKFQKIEFNPLLQLGTVEYYLVDTFVNYFSKFICVVRKACLKFVYDLLTLS